MSLARIIDDCDCGRLLPRMAYIRLAIEGYDAANVLFALRQRGPLSAPLQNLRDTIASHPGAACMIRTMLRTVDHEHQGLGISSLAAMFDRAVEQSPAASVTLNSLGDEELLAQTTADVTAFILSLGLVGPHSDVLDFGCGIGRFSAALAPHVRHVNGIDISTNMISEAGRRNTGSNVVFAVSDGEHLPFPDHCFDFILAADVFPYLVQVSAELAAATIRECARCLRAQGSLLVLNFSYRDDEPGDRRDLLTFAKSAGLRLFEGPRAPFRHWDGVPFLLRAKLKAMTR